MTLRPKDVPCIACHRFRVDTYRPICPSCTTILGYDEVNQILRDHLQFSIDIPRIPTDPDFLSMTDYLLGVNRVAVDRDTTMSMTVHLTDNQVKRCNVFDANKALATIANIHFPNVVEVATRIMIKSPSSTLLSIRKVLPGESETTH